MVPQMPLLNTSTTTPTRYCSATPSSCMFIWKQPSPA
ncbi:Uncharacterised protein [Bordetella pertussis]|nr:Uncharacterised protein [Bordetella pertussis]